VLGVAALAATAAGADAGYEKATVEGV